MSEIVDKMVVIIINFFIYFEMCLIGFLFFLILIYIEKKKFKIEGKFKF